MMTSLACSLMLAVTQQQSTPSPFVLPTLFDEPNYNRDDLELGADKGRRPDIKSNIKGLLTVPTCERHLRELFPGAQIRCDLSYPLGWSASVPLKATVSNKNGLVDQYFIKFCDDDEEILNDSEKEFVWQQALWTQGIITIPKPVLFDRSRRILVSCQAKGISVAKSLFDVPMYRYQVAKMMANIHALKIETLPSQTLLFLRPVQKAIDEVLKPNLFDPNAVGKIKVYAGLLEAAIYNRYDPSTMATAVHGDMKAGNMLIQEELKTLTFTDFGLAHRGDPAGDIGFFLADGHRPMADLQSFVDDYADGNEMTPHFVERAMLHTAYNRLERYIRFQDWYAGDPGAKNTMAALVAQDFDWVSPLLPQPMMPR